MKKEIKHIMQDGDLVIELSVISPPVIEGADPSAKLILTSDSMRAGVLHMVSKKKYNNLEGLLSDISVNIAKQTPEAILNCLTLMVLSNPAVVEDLLGVDLKPDTSVEGFKDGGVRLNDLKKVN